MSAPQTAADVIARLDELLAQVSPHERREFWLKIHNHPDNVIRDIFEAINNKAKEAVGALWRKATVAEEKSAEDEAKLQKYRRTAVNTERDAEIMRLHREKRTAGQIVAALASRWKLTDKRVNAVISRQRRKQKD